VTRAEMSRFCPRYKHRPAVTSTVAAPAWIHDSPGTRHRPVEQRPGRTLPLSRLFPSSVSQTPHLTNGHIKQLRWFYLSNEIVSQN
jgi:hypothetical protein